MNSKSLLSPILASLLAFVLAAGLGLALRWAFVLDMPEWFDYRNIQHAHSHVALLGWLFGIFCLCIIHYLDLDYSRYARLYWTLQSTVVGMLLTFPVMGYASLSIIFSTSHIIFAYILAYRIWREIISLELEGGHVLFIKISLLFMVLSTLGTWALGPIMGAGLKGSAIYYAAIQFYLHFQFNGWFIFAMIGLTLAILHRSAISFEWAKVRLFYWLLLISTILTYALAITWSTPYKVIFIVNSIGVVLQLLALIGFLHLLYGKRKEIKSYIPKYMYSIFVVSLLALVLKIVIQAIVVIPYMAEVSYTIRNFVIGFIHLLMLGSLSLFAFGSISQILKKALSKWGTWIFVIGVVLSELLLFVQGFMVWQGWGFMPHYYLLLGLASGLILIGVIIITIDLWSLKWGKAQL